MNAFNTKAVKYKDKITLKKNTLFIRQIKKTKESGEVQTKSTKLHLTQWF